MFLSTNNGYRRNTRRSTRQVMAALMFRIATLRNGTSRNCWWEQLISCRRLRRHSLLLTLPFLTS